MTHKELVARVSKWLRNTKRCPVVFQDLYTYAGERPDVIGFFSDGTSLLIECKISRSDFISDIKKPHRAFDENGMGDTRYYATPHGVLRSEEEIPNGWGLIIVREYSITITKHPTQRESVNKRSEVLMLSSAIRRLQLSTAVFIRQDEEDLQNQIPIEKRASKNWTSTSGESLDDEMLDSCGKF